MKASTWFWSGVLLFIFIMSAQSGISSASLAQNMDQVLARFSTEHWLGTDTLGRDYWSRLWLGTRNTLGIAFAATLISLFVGTMTARLLIQLQGWKNQMLFRAVDLLQGLPSFLIISVVMSWSASSSLLILISLMGLIHWPYLARLLHAEMTKLKVELYVEAARALGASEKQIFWTHYFSALKKVGLIWLCFNIPTEMMFESSMSFLGFGVKAPQTSLGALIMEGWPHLHSSPQLLLAPATVILLLILGIKNLSDHTLNRKNKTSPSLT